MKTEQTFVVLGCYFSGTSMITGIMRKMGIFMGERFNNSGNHEDLDFQLKGISDVREIIKKRNEDHYIWGWKDPYSVNYIESVLDLLVNPHFIVIFRDVLSIAQHMITDFKSDLRSSLLFANAIETRLTSFFYRYCSNYPVLPVSFEKSRNEGNSFVEEISKFCNIELSEQNLNEISGWIAEKRYKSF